MDTVIAFFNFLHNGFRCLQRFLPELLKRGAKKANPPMEPGALFYALNILPQKETDSLLLRFNTAQRGRVLLDGADLAELRARDLRRAVALVPQQSSVFSGTVAEAIAFGRPATREQIVAAARLANAADFIEALPGGYDGRIEERGSNFSGGQLQRLAIARAVLGNPAVLLLDEATSALDAESEEAVQRGLRRAMQGRTVLVIAHRLATVQEADQIVVLEAGRIVEVGSHDVLMARGGRYRELCLRQLIRVEA